MATATPDREPRLAQVGDATAVAVLLDAFNREFDTETPGVDVLTARLLRHLAGDAMFAILYADLGVALVSLRPNAWYAGPAALLDELYVVPSRRGNGIGARLLRAAESEVLRRGGEALEINVDGGDTDARRFYERHGYSPTEPGQPGPAYWYAKTLPTR